jgi:hypothetical protein
MNLLLRAMTLGMVFVAGVLLASVVIVVIVTRFFACIPERGACDAGGMFGFFLWLVVAPSAGALSALFAQRWLAARDRRQVVQQ